MGCSAVFKSQDLTGDFLVCPLRSYHTFFAEKIENSSGCTRAALIIANFITGVVAYPLFGLFALIGMLVKSAGVEGLRAHNRAQITTVRNQEAALAIEKEQLVVNERSSHGRPVLHRDFTITKANAQVQYQHVIWAIERCSDDLRRIYLDCAGTIDVKTGTGSIGISLLSNYL